MSEKIFEFRRLSAKDILPMAKIINLIGIEQFKSALEVSDVISENDDQLAAVGMGVVFDILSIIMTGYEKCEKELFTFLASISNLKVKEIQDMDLATFAEMLQEFLQKEELGDFIKVVSRLLPSMQ